MAKKKKDSNVSRVKSVEELRAELEGFIPEVPAAPARCPITMGEFQDGAKVMYLEVLGTDKKVEAVPKIFRTQSFGWNFTGKFVVVIGGVQVPVQINGNMIVIGSKPQE